jgi:hypothetical protein
MHCGAGSEPVIRVACCLPVDPSPRQRRKGECRRVAIFPPAAVLPGALASSGATTSASPTASRTESDVEARTGRLQANPNFASGNLWRVWHSCKLVRPYTP